MAARTALTILATLGGVTASEIAAGAVGTSEIADGTIGAADMSNEAKAASLLFAIVDAATDANVANLGSGAPNIVDGYSVGADEDVLVWQQSTGAQNGIYNVDTVGTGADGAWTRDAARDTAAELPVGMLVYVRNGDTYANTLFKLTGFDGTLDTDTVTFELHQEGMTVTNSGEPEDVGTGDGSTLNFDLSTSGVVAATVFVDGISQPPGNWAIAAGAGAGGVDQLQFGAGNAPPNSSTVEVLALTRT